MGVSDTSRAAKAGEQEGREYHFRTKDELLQKIRSGDMIEWGELDNQVYGTRSYSATPFLVLFFKEGICA